MGIEIFALYSLAFLALFWGYSFLYLRRVIIPILNGESFDTSTNKRILERLFMCYAISTAIAMLSKIAKNIFMSI